MAVTRQKKEEILQELVDKFGKSKSVVFAANLGLSVSELADLRSQLRESNIEFQIAKKTLFRKASESNGIEGLTNDILDGPVGAAISYEDQVLPAKILAKFAKKNDRLSIVAGIMDAKIMSQDEVVKLSSLPSKEELLAKFMGSLQSPLSGFVGVGNALIGGLVRTLDQIRMQKEAS